MESFVLPDGRTLEYHAEGPAGARPLVWHHGTPSAAAPSAALLDAATRHGLRLVLLSRPGYGTSSPHPGRTVADVAADVAALLDHLGAAEFVTAGWSGGGPHALACAALLPERCRAAATLAGVAPLDVPFAQWLEGMGADNHAEFAAARDGADRLGPYLTEAADGLDELRGDQVAEALGNLLSETDRAALTGELADYVALSLRRGVLTGTAGWRDDDLAFVRDWGFDPGAITPPVTVWQGDQDRMVPYAHSGLLAARMPAATLRQLPGEGHISLLTHAGTILGELAATAG